MEQEFLNRTGIAMNLAAGFLMAPDIIGEKNFTLWEQQLEVVLAKRRISVQRSVQKVSHMHKYFSYFPFDPNAARPFLKKVLNFLTITSIASTIIYFSLIWKWPYFFASFKIFIPLIVSICLLLLSGFMSIWDYFSNNRILSIIFNSLLYISLSILAIYIGPIIFILFIWFLYIPWFLLKMIEFIEARMAGRDDRLMSYFVKVGIILFILGNFLQYYATYLPASAEVSNTK